MIQETEWLERKQKNYKMNYIEINTQKQTGHKLGQIFEKNTKWIKEWLAKFQT